MKILILCESLIPSSGWGSYAKGLTEALRKQGHDLTVLRTGDNDPPPFILPNIHDPSIAWVIKKIELWFWLRTHHFDLIHVMVEPYARLYRAFGRKPYILTVHGTYAKPEAHGRNAGVFRRAMRHARRIIAVSEYTSAHIPIEFLNKTTVIPNGVDMGIVDEPYDEQPKQGNPMILAVGAMKRRKGYAELINGFNVFRQIHPDAMLCIVGELEDHGYLIEILKNKRYAGVYYGNIVTRRKLLGLYRACDIFALTPVNEGLAFEGFGLVYLEANAFGKPCVGSIESGVGYTVHDGVTGYAVDPRNAGAIAFALEHSALFYTDRPEDITERVRRLSWDTRVPLYAEVYRT